MAVIEALMSLFIKEQVSVDRVLTTVKRFSTSVSASEAPTDPDAALILWAKRCCEALKLRIEAESDQVCYERNLSFHKNFVKIQTKILTVFPIENRKSL